MKVTTSCFKIALVSALSVSLQFILATEAFAQKAANVAPAKVVPTKNTITITVPYWDFQKVTEKGQGGRVFSKDVKVKVNDSENLPGQITVRGQSCVQSQRPCLELETTQEIQLGSAEGKMSLSGKHFNMVSMWQDVGYISSNIGYRVANAAEVSKFKTEYAEVVLRGSSGQSQSLGLYLITQRPDSAALKSQNAEFVGRRRYRGGFETKGIAKKGLDEAAIQAIDTKYHSAFTALYAEVAQNSGEQLWKSLESKIDIKAYMRWLAMNYLVRNGDYSDEVFFSGAVDKDGQPYFRPFPWDFDDLFKPMHSVIIISKDPAKYPGSRLYSYEDPLDLKIASDKFLYDQYENIQAELLSTVLTNEKIDSILNAVKIQILPYLDSADIMNSSYTDDGPRAIGLRSYNKQAILNLIEQRRSELKQRRQEVLAAKQSLK